jgi:hypothetical protein
LLLARPMRARSPRVFRLATRVLSGLEEMNHEPGTRSPEARVTILTRSRNSVVSHPSIHRSTPRHYLHDPPDQRPAYGNIRFHDGNGLEPENQKTVLLCRILAAQKNGLSKPEGLDG